MIDISLAQDMTRFIQVVGELTKRAMDSHRKQASQHTKVAADINDTLDYLVNAKLIPAAHRKLAAEKLADHRQSLELLRELGAEHIAVLDNGHQPGLELGAPEKRANHRQGERPVVVGGSYPGAHSEADAAFFARIVN